MLKGHVYVAWLILNFGAAYISLESWCWCWSLCYSPPFDIILRSDCQCCFEIKKVFSAWANCFGLSDTFRMSGGSLFHWFGPDTENCSVTADARVMKFCILVELSSVSLGAINCSLIGVFWWGHVTYWWCDPFFKFWLQFNWIYIFGIIETGHFQILCAVWYGGVLVHAILHDTLKDVYYYDDRLPPKRHVFRVIWPL